MSLKQAQESVGPLLDTSFDWNIGILRQWRSVKPSYRFPIAFQNVKLPDGTTHDIRSFVWMKKNL